MVSESLVPWVSQSEPQPGPLGWMSELVLLVMLLGLASPVATNAKPRWKFQPSRGRFGALSIRVGASGCQFGSCWDAWTAVWVVAYSWGDVKWAGKKCFPFFFQATWGPSNWCAGVDTVFKIDKYLNGGKSTSSTGQGWKHLLSVVHSYLVKWVSKKVSTKTFSDLLRSSVTVLSSCGVGEGLATLCMYHAQVVHS